MQRRTTYGKWRAQEDEHHNSGTRTSSTLPITSHRGFRFLELPLEIRQQIYRLLYIRGNPTTGIYTYHDEWIAKYSNKNGSLLRVSKQVSEEVTEVLYGENLFDGTLGLTRWFLGETLQRVRKLQLVVSGKDYTSFEDGTWENSINFSRITKLVLVPQFPQGSEVFPEKLEDWLQKREWLENFERFLKSLSRKLPDRLVIEVDHNYNTEVMALFDVYFPRRYKEVQTWPGDRWYRRGKFFPELPSWER
jgi:hypothetical protein